MYLFPRRRAVFDFDCHHGVVDADAMVMVLEAASGRLWPIGGCGDPHEKSQVDNWWFCFPPKCLTSAKHGGTSLTPTGIFCCDTRYHSLVLNATYSYVHPHEINVGKTVGIPHEIDKSAPLWATAYQTYSLQENTCAAAAYFWITI